jgi:hypothetical protein
LSNHESTQRLHAKARGLFEKGVDGWKFATLINLIGSEVDLGLTLGASQHNGTSIFFKDPDGRIIGARFNCQCTLCLAQQSHFTLRTRVEIYGMGTGSISIVLDPEDDNAVQLIERKCSLLEEWTVARKNAERQRDLAEKRALATGINHLARATGPLLKDKNGRTWTRAQLLSMCEAQQRETPRLR